MWLFDKIKNAVNPPFDRRRRDMVLQTAAMGTAQVATGNAVVNAESDPEALANAEKLARIEIQDLFKKALAATQHFMDKNLGFSLNATIYRDGNGSFVKQTQQMLDGERVAYDTLRERVRAFTERFQTPLTFADLMPDTSNIPDGFRDTSSGKTPIEELKKKYENGIRHFLPEFRGSLDMPLTAETIKPLPVWDSRRTEASITAQYCDRLKPTVQALVRIAENTLSPDQAKELVSGFLRGNNDLMNAHGDAVKPHLEKIASALESRGTNLVDDVLKRQAKEAATAIEEAAKAQRRVVEKIQRRFGDIVPSSDKAIASGKQKFFLPLSEKEEGAEGKLKLIEEILGSRRYSEEPRSIRYDDALITKELEPKRVWPKDRAVPVPTQGYVRAYGVDLSLRELGELHDYMKQHPNIAKILMPHISDFGLSEEISR